MQRDRLSLAVALSILASSALGAAPQGTAAAQEWERVYWDAPRADGSLYGGRLRLPRPADPATVPVVPAPLTTLAVAGEPDNRIDVVIVGDGYTAGELGRFQQDATAMAAAFLAKQPYSEYAEYFVLHMVDVVSNESGVDNDPTLGIDRDTALDMAFWCSGIERLLCVNVRLTPKSRLRSALRRTQDRSGECPGIPTRTTRLRYARSDRARGETRWTGRQWGFWARSC